MKNYTCILPHEVPATGEVVVTIADTRLELYGNLQPRADDDSWQRFRDIGVSGEGVHVVLNIALRVDCMSGHECSDLFSQISKPNWVSSKISSSTRGGLGNVSYSMNLFLVYSQLFGKVDVRDDVEMALAKHLSGGFTQCTELVVHIMDDNAERIPSSTQLSLKKGSQNSDDRHKCAENVILSALYDATVLHMNLDKCTFRNHSDVYPTIKVNLAIAAKTVVVFDSFKLRFTFRGRPTFRSAMQQFQVTDCAFSASHRYIRDMRDATETLVPFSFSVIEPTADALAESASIVTDWLVDYVSMGGKLELIKCVRFAYGGNTRANFGDFAPNANLVAASKQFMRSIYNLHSVSKHLSVLIESDILDLYGSAYPNKSQDRQPPNVFMYNEMCLTMGTITTDREWDEPGVHILTTSDDFSGSDELKM